MTTSALRFPNAFTEGRLALTGDEEEDPRVLEREARSELAATGFGTGARVFRITRVHFFLLILQDSQRTPKGLLEGRVQGTSLEKQRTH